MTTVFDSLKSVNAYPIPNRKIEEVAVRRGLPLNAEATPIVLNSGAYKLAEADLYAWLSMSPAISQGGQTYSFSDEQRTHLKKLAMRLYDKYDYDTICSEYGYKGCRL